MVWVEWLKFASRKPLLSQLKFIPEGGAKILGFAGAGPDFDPNGNGRKRGFVEGGGLRGRVRRRPMRPCPRRGGWDGRDRATEGAGFLLDSDDFV